MADRGRSPKGAARREQILRAAFFVIGRDGYHAASLGRIAREIGIEVPHLLYYFDNREDLLREVIMRWDEQNLHALPADVDYLELVRRAVHQNLAFRGVVHAYLGFATEAIGEAHPAREFFRDRFAQVFAGLEEVLRDGQRAGLIRPELDIPSVARRIVALSDGLQLQGLIDPSLDASYDLDASLGELFVDGRIADIPGRRFGGPDRSREHAAEPDPDPVVATS